MSPSFSPLSACLVLSVLINHSIPQSAPCLNLNTLTQIMQSDQIPPSWRGLSQWIWCVTATAGMRFITLRMYSFCVSGWTAHSNLWRPCGFENVLTSYLKFVGIQNARLKFSFRILKTFLHWVLAFSIVGNFHAILILDPLSEIWFSPPQEFLRSFCIQGSKISGWDFPGGPEVKNPPSIAGNWAHAPQRKDPTCRK